MKGITVQLKNFSAFKGRADNKHNSWFRLSNRLLEDPDFFEFTPAEILVWIYILSLASQKNSDTVFINFERADRISRLKKRDILAAIEKLQPNQLLPLQDPASNSQVSAKSATDNTDKQNNTIQANAEAFALFYSRYPRKEKKKEAQKRFDALVASGISPELVMKGLSNYLAKLAREKTDPKFYKQPTTWLNELPENWINEDSSSTVAVKNVNYSEMATEIYHWVSGNNASISDQARVLAEKIGFVQLKQMHRDDFRPGGQVPLLLKQAAEGRAS